MVGLDEKDHYIASPETRRVVGAEQPGNAADSLRIINGQTVPLDCRQRIRGDVENGDIVPGRAEAAGPDPTHGPGATQ